MRQTIRATITLCALALPCLPACAGGDGDSAPSHSADIQPIWNDSCLSSANASCHMDGGEYELMLLSEGDAYDALVDKAAVGTAQTTKMDLVTPGDPDNSYLLHKLEGTHVSEAEGLGDTMPCADAAFLDCVGDSTPLSADDIQLVEDWIAGGAEP